MVKSDIEEKRKACLWCRSKIRQIPTLLRDFKPRSGPAAFQGTLRRRIPLFGSHSPGENFQMLLFSSTALHRCIFIAHMIQVLQLTGIFGLKILVQSYEKVTNTNNLTPGYVGYAILCGLITASFAVAMPDENQCTKIVFASAIGSFTAVTMGVEFAFNEYQTINGTDFWIDMSLTIPVAILVVIIYAVLHKLRKLESNFSFGCFIIAFVPLMYLLVPTIHFNSITTRVIIVIIGVVVYMTVSVYLMVQS